MKTTTCQISGFSVLELLVTLAIMGIIGAITTAVVVDGNRVFSDESVRQVANEQARHALAKTVRRVRETAARTAWVNLKLNYPPGTPIVRDGLLLWTDSDHRTIYLDRDPVDNLPDTVGWDDRDGDGKTDILALALMPQDEDKDGVQDFVDLDEDSVADDVVTREGVTDGFPDLKYHLVLTRFKNRDEAIIPSNWSGHYVQVLARDVVPFVTKIRGVTRYDTIEVAGIRPESYDFGHDRDFSNPDSFQGDGLVDEIELGLADDFADRRINTQKERDLIGSIKVTVATALELDAKRLDMGVSVTSTAPRSFQIVDQTGLQYPNP